MIIVDNSNGHDVQTDLQRAYKQIGKWANETPTNPIAQKWLEANKKQ